MLNEPKMYYNITQPPSNQGGVGGQESAAINVCSMDFPEDETDKFFIGSEDYNLY
jgi:hypothetical protein